MKKNNFKTHMIRFATHDYYNGVDDGFRTYCGITEECSEGIRDNESFVKNHNEIRTTCKKCLRSYKKFLRLEEKRVRKELDATARSK